MTDALLLSAAELRRRLGPDTVVIDCRFSLADPRLGYRQYREGHVPGAHYFSLDMDMSGPVAPHGGRHPLPDTKDFVAKLRATGVNNDSLVVAYDDSGLAFAARLWWLLRYCGHTRVALLQGGFSAWSNAGYPRDRRTPDSDNGTFDPRLQLDWVVDVEQVQRLVKRGSAVLIDSREAHRYRGEEEPVDPVAGHIPGALNFPWQDAIDGGGCALPAAGQQARWQALPDDRNLVVYCGSGVTACVNLLSLHMAGKQARLYPGSWSDWCSYPQLPVATQVSQPG
ncbi:sulfurtransferase [Exilibacterium tricleocarpae]|uniref:Sulfurtransferase n=1 Tax=Exilibacterium tricleocarpae TaxID=2591008 RepID=A0A545TLW9_9GAMM|nr:sulfurtransferase [Exilibacterium tricleocarpae]TQV78245.1 sulfurtransferase [Exilibacterium tricleocarpae]